MSNSPVFGNDRFLVKVVKDSTFPNSTKVTYKCLVCRIKVSGWANLALHSNLVNDTSGDNVSYSDTNTQNLAVTIEDGDPNRAIMCCNFRNNKIVENAYYFAFMVGNFCVLDNQAAFLENL